jgi:hypothetical protein
MQTLRYTLRVSVRMLEKESILGLDSEPSITIGAIRITVKQHGPYLVLQAENFDSESNAEAFLPHIKRGLWNIAIEHNIAFSSYSERRDITRPENPEVAARNLAKSFGMIVTEPVQPVHGLTEEEGYTIFPTNENIRFLSLGDCTGHVSQAWEAVEKTLRESLQKSKSGVDKLDNALSIAIDLYLSHFYEASIRARFLTLMMALEVLAPVTEKHPEVVKILADFQKAIETQISNTTNLETLDALEALRREINFRKETSIRRRVRSLVLNEAPLDESSRRNLAKKIVAAYDLRGTVVHTGAIDQQILSEANDTVLQTVKLILRVRLGLNVTASCLELNQFFRSSQNRSGDR